MGYSLCKMLSSVFGSKVKIAKKQAKNDSTSTLELFYARNASKKN